MDLRTKLVFALVAVSLGSMLALGVFTYDAVRELFQRGALRQLDAVAESKKQDLQKVIQAWRDRVQLVAARPNLREGLIAHRRSRAPDEKEALRLEIEELLGDALRSLRALRGLIVYAPDGYPIASVGLAPSASTRLHPATFFLAEDPVAYENVFRDPDGDLVVAFVATVRDQGRNVGALKVMLAASELVAVTQDYTGLGESGETLMAMRTKESGALVVNPLRHDPDAALRLTIPPEREQDPMIRAVRGEEEIVRENALDYRGHDVWAATRHLDEFDWGLVVKVDADEEIRSVTEFRDTMGKLALSLSAFAIVTGTLLGLYVARPIQELADSVERIAAGELHVRARTDGEDEIALLARTVNKMAEELADNKRKLDEMQS